MKSTLIWKSNDQKQLVQMLRRSEQMDSIRSFNRIDFFYSIHERNSQGSHLRQLSIRRDMDLCIVYLLHAFVLVSRSRFLMDRSRALRLY